MHKTEPQVFLVGETRLMDDEPTNINGAHIGLQSYLRYVKAGDWKTDAPSDSEKLTEAMGRLCYRSWAPGLNPNVTRVRQGNDKYLGHVIEVGHGSVFEHATLNFIFADVSRVFTHELVRHRAGTAISQESLRFVRLDDLSSWAPSAIREDEHAMTIFSKTFEQLEKLQIELSEHFKLDEEGVPFSKKKEITSALRRLAPEGIGTTIGWSTNFRSLRHVIEMRTSRHAEEELRVVFSKVAELVVAKYPNMMSDYTSVEVDGIKEWSTNHKKI